MLRTKNGGAVIWRQILTNDEHGLSCGSTIRRFQSPHLQNFLSTSSVLLHFFDRSCAILQELRIRALFLLDAPFLTPSVFCRSFFRNRHPFAGQFGRKALVISSPNEAGTPFLLLWHPEGWYLISFAQDISAFSQAGNAYELPFISHRFA
jgi:hypothetical protein